MDNKIRYILVLCCVAALLPLLGACDEDEVAMPGSRQIECTATMPGESRQSSPSRKVVSVPSGEGSLDLIARWKEGDEIQIFVRQAGKVYKTDKAAAVYGISGDGKSCSFRFTLPSSVDPEKDYEVIGVTGVETVTVSGTDVVAVSTLRRVSLESDGEAPSPMWFVTAMSASTTALEARFRHLGTYEVLHVKNKSGSSMTFRHRGFEVSRQWYKSSDNTVLSDSYNPTTAGGTGDVESAKSLTIAAGATGKVLSWYIPTGATIVSARLKATVNGKSVSSSDTITSTVAIERGRAYHMYVTWDGKELRFNERDSCPDGNHPHAIDLGLPSGTKWACCNVGAGTPEAYGNYYAWGETQPKSVYDWSTYKWGKDYNYNSLTKYCTSSSYGYNGFVDNKTELEPADDAATANWGSGWRMPSTTQIQELLDNCSSQWTTRNGVNGRLFTSKRNGASLFLPAAGCRYDSELYDAGSYGYYWSRTLYTSYPYGAYSLYFSSGNVHWGIYWSDRSSGQGVRAVRVAQN